MTTHHQAKGEQDVNSEITQKRGITLTTALLASSVFVRPTAASELGAITTYTKNSHVQQDRQMIYTWTTTSYITSHLLLAAVMATDLLLVQDISFACLVLSHPQI